jgi:uncharacterized membrane protein
LGITLVWRGDRVARRLPPFGHALIGVGLGVVYLSLYLGHFNLHVLPTVAALPLLVLVAVGSILVGLRYRVQAIAILGVFGAFVPQLMAAWIPLQGFAMTPNAMLVYLAIVNVVVFLLSARAGWSSLDLVSLLLSAVTWICQFPGAAWGWTAQSGLSVLFTALGLSPLPRLARRDVVLRDIDLAVIAVAPLCLVAVSWPFIVRAPQQPAAILLFSIAAIYLLAALWVDSRRPERDLWRPLTGAAVMFLTAALQRALGNTLTPMAWTVEGILLVWLGLRPRGGWLRACGYAVLGMGTLWALGTLFESGGWRNDQLPVVYPVGIRNLTCIAWMLVGAWLMARGREHLSEAERYIPEVWTGIGNLMLMVWMQREAAHLASAMEGPGGRWSHPRGPADPAMFARQTALGAALTGLVWMAQSTWLTVTGNRPERLFLRVCGGLVGIGAVTAVIVAVCGPDAWTYGQLPVLHSVGIIIATSIALAGWNAVVLRSRSREHRSDAERVIPELWTGVANLMLMLWTQREASHLAIALEGVPERWPDPRNPNAPPRLDRLAQLGFALTALCWMVQASWLMVIGSRAGRLVLRACGYVIGFAATVRAYIALCSADGWSGDQLPALYPTGLILLASIVLAALTAATLAGRRGTLHENERYLPEVAAMAASALMLAWTSREAHHLAQSVIGIPGPNAGALGQRMAARASILAASITSAGWLLEALFLLVLGWIRSSAFLRWSGLVLTGITVLKFLLLDLQTVDVFWRFLTAIIVGVALLGISYAYQRRARGSGPATPS